MADQEEDIAIRGAQQHTMPSQNPHGVKRDRNGNAKRFDKKDAPKPVVRNAYTPMFEKFRDELDEHHDRRERIIKASRDVTALSKKIIFSCQRVRKIQPDLPTDVNDEIESRLSDVAKLLGSIACDVQGLNRWRYMRSMISLEELIEALTFAHYLRHQSLLDFTEATAILAQLCQNGATSAVGDDGETTGGDEDPAANTEMRVDSSTITLTEEDFLMGVFDLSGEMMRFATTTAALNGELASASESGRTIVTDMQELGSFFEMLPQKSDKTWQFKMRNLRTSVKKVERLGYGLTVRGSERPKGWMPETKESEPSSPI